jgi:hypothetical protein
MSTINDGGPAFPVGSGDMRDPVGMTLRDYFAATAMQGLFAAGGGVTRGAEEWARLAYTMADAMLAARKEKS